MFRRSLILGSLSLVLSAGAYSEGFKSNPEAATSGFSGPSQGEMTVKQVHDIGAFSDDTFVTLVGYIKSAVGDETYVFADDTGEIHVEIDNEDWLGQSVSPDTKVKITGELDQDVMNKSIDVSSIKVL